MKNFYFLVVAILLSVESIAQESYGPRINALGNAGVALQDVWAAQQNQAGLAGLKRPEVGLGFENRFGIKDLSTQSAAFAFPLKTFAIGAAFRSYGVNAFREMKTGLSLAKSFGPRLFLAVGLNYHQLNISNYGNANTLSIDVGLQYQLASKLWIASHIANPNQSKYSDNANQVIPTHIQFGASFTFSEHLMLVSEIEKVLDREADFKTGIEYQLIPFLALRGGMSANPFKQYAGFGLNYQKLRIDFAVSSHPTLGYSPQIALGYEF